MKNPDIKIVRSGEQMRNVMMTHERVFLTLQAKYATDLIRTTLMTGMPDGETTAGEQKHRPLTPEEAVERAVVATEKLFEAMENKGWILEVPSLDDLRTADVDHTKTGF
jgi:hypothetical protein